MEDIRKGVCPLCQHNEIVESVPKVVAGATNLRTYPLVAQADQGFWNVSSHGALALYACRRCGYAQLFARAPGEIPIGEEYETRLVKGSETGSPYR
jgi:hypothetical protein